MFWGTFEDHEHLGRQLDMSNAEVQSLYYDAPDAYARLQAIKRWIDPANVFATSFTVPP